MCETLKTQIKRRIKVAGLFPNTDSILRLVTAILVGISEEWETGKAHINPNKNVTKKLILNIKQPQPA